MDSIKSGGRPCSPVRQHRGMRCALTGMIVALGTAQACAQCAEQQKLTNSDEAAHDFFGGSVSVSGDTVMVRSSSDDCAAGDRCGAVDVFSFNGTGWVEEQKLTASGGPVFVSGDTAVLGAAFDDCSEGENCGAAYVFRFDGTSWVEEQKLVASDASPHALFGRSVAVSGDTLVLGASRLTCLAGIRCGSAYVFHFNGTTWVEEQKLTPSDAPLSDPFGLSVSASRETVIVGAPRGSGAAYVYRFNGTGWVEEQKLAASDAAAGDQFGFSVSVSGDTALVGAPTDDCAVSLDCGSAYVYRFNGVSWVEEQKLTASDAATSSSFGKSVSVDRDTVVIGAMLDDCAAGNQCGSAYVFRFDGSTWMEKRKLTASDAAARDWFGSNVAVSGETVVVGAFTKDCALGPNCGSAYVFSCVVTPRVVSLDIRPGSCPNPVNPKSQGVVPVAILGSSQFDVSRIDPDSLTLVRATGVGESISPLVGRRGSGVSIRDVAAPCDDELCACDELGGDGIDDLVLTFSASEMSRALRLSALPRGVTVRLLLRGSLRNGTTFEAVDDIVIRGRDMDGTGDICPFEAATVWSSTQSLDQGIDAGEFPLLQQPERYTMAPGGRLDRALLTLDIAGLEDLWFGAITEVATVVPLGERTQLYRIDNAFGLSGLVGRGFLTIWTFEIQCQGSQVTWTFNYEFSLEVVPVNVPPTIARLTTISGTQVGIRTEDGSRIEWSVPSGTWDRSGAVGQIHLPLGDVVTPGTWSLEAGVVSRRVRTGLMTHPLRSRRPR